jgi:hypothetical protein
MKYLLKKPGFGAGQANSGLAFWIAIYKNDQTTKQLARGIRGVPHLALVAASAFHLAQEGTARSMHVRK